MSLRSSFPLLSRASRLATSAGPGRGRAWSLSPPDRRALCRVLFALSLTRLILYVTGAFAIRILPPLVEPRVQVLLGKNLSLAAWVRWDSAWYLSVAERGYWFDPNGPSNVAFFPLLPLLIRAVGVLTGNLVAAGLLVTNLATLGVVLALWRWVRAEAGTAAAERATLWLLVYPFSFFFHSVYAESLFFLLTVLSLHANARGHRLASGIWGSLAAASRPMGVLLAPALAWGLWQERRAGRAVRLRDVLAVLLPVAGLGAYLLYLWIAFGDPLVFWKAHAVGWHVQFQWALAKYWRETLWIVTRLARIHGYVQLLDAMRVLLPLIFAGLTVQVFRRLGAVPGIYTALAVAVATVFAPDSMGRELLAAVPAFAVLGMVGPRGTVGEGLRLFSLGLLLIFLFAFVTGHFVG